MDSPDNGLLISKDVTARPAAASVTTQQLSDAKEFANSLLCGDNIIIK